jgi:glycosyltransferase involved in cell wall biosynthesis
VKVGFDISQIAHSGGVSVYTQNLSENLLRIPDLEMKFFYSSLRKPYSGKLPSVKELFLPPSLFEILFNRIRFVPIDNFLGPVDIFHSSDWVQPPTRAKKVTTYHDLIPLKFPKWSHPKIVAVHKRRLEIVEKEIDMVIAVSESTKNDLLEISKIPEKKIKVIYEAAGKQFKPQSENDIEEFKKKLGLPDKYILAIGGIGERKNLERIKNACSDFNLVIAGETISQIEEKDMPLLYAAATLLVYTSLYEGFGLPILEAMNCGTPVITSDTSSMPEVGGKAAVYADPRNESDIGNKILNVMEDKKFRLELIKKGFEQAKNFSWEKCAQETYDVYKNVI